MSKPYRCLNFLPSLDGKCRMCGETSATHFNFERDWTPPPIDDEYREKRSIELVEIGPPKEGK